MKKIILSGIALVSLLALTGTALAAKPAGNLAGAQKFAWHLSGDVMPVPPYGSADIPGSDTASKLIANQPNGNVGVVITGAMNGLHPNTPYTVYLSNVYTPYVFTGWDVQGAWNITFEYLGSYYTHSASLTQSGFGVLGNGGYPAGGPYQYSWHITSGSISDNTITLAVLYDTGATGTVMDMTGTIAADGTISGTWSDNYGGPRAGTWSTTSGQATKMFSGNAGWPGLLTSEVQPFTFDTDSNGSGSWHINLLADDASALNGFSAWINEAGKTILISDSVPILK